MIPVAVTKWIFWSHSIWMSTDGRYDHDFEAVLTIYDLLIARSELGHTQKN